MKIRKSEIPYSSNVIVTNNKRQLFRKAKLNTPAKVIPNASMQTMNNNFYPPVLTTSSQSIIQKVSTAVSQNISNTSNTKTNSKESLTENIYSKCVVNTTGLKSFFKQVPLRSSTIINISSQVKSHLSNTNIINSTNESIALRRVKANDPHEERMEEQRSYCRTKSIEKALKESTPQPKKAFKSLARMNTFVINSYSENPELEERFLKYSFK